MAFKHGIEATLKIGTTQFEGYIENTGMNLERELAEIRTLSGAAVQRVAGLRNITFTADGAWDATADAALYALWNGSATGSVVFSPDGGTTTYTCNCWLGTYAITAGSGDKVGWSIDLASDGTVTRASI